MSNQTSRRSFLKEIASMGGAAAAMAYASPGWASALSAAAPLGLPIGTQTYPFRDRIGTDFIGLLKELRAAGYNSLELCSPVSYPTTPFATLSKYTPAELKKVAADEGFTIDSAHFDLKELREAPDKAIEWARGAGLKQMVFWSLNGGNSPTEDTVKKVADEFNALGQKVAAGGLQLLTHNEGFETSTVDGRRTYDVLLELTDPRYANFQFQISTIRRGFDAAEYMTKYPGRFVSLHLQDWDPAAQQTKAIGQGTLDWKKIFTAAKTGGVKRYFVELNLEATKASAPFLKRLTV